MGEKGKAGKKVSSVIGLILCIIFGLMLIFNLVIIVQGIVNPASPPSVFGLTPLVVQSGSMSSSEPGHIEVGDLIFIKSTDPRLIQVGDVVTYQDGSVLVTHRVTEITPSEEYGLVFTTKGDANNVEDMRLVASDAIVGKFIFRIPKLGDFATFLQSPLGMLIFIGIPIIAFFGVDIVKRAKKGNAEQESKQAMQEELERLRAAAAEAAAKEDVSKDTKP